MMNKTVYLGQSILDISKTLMYEFYYDYLKKNTIMTSNYVIQTQIVS